ncbi:hypothetical protein GCM10010381_09270 [Streptomyces xantholiticus]|nr:hypothetical protein GCM10010381_09270 [Streptomyces xantholiticus]
MTAEVNVADMRDLGLKNPGLRRKGSSFVNGRGQAGEPPQEAVAKRADQPSDPAREQGQRAAATEAAFTMSPYRGMTNRPSPMAAPFPRPPNDVRWSRQGGQDLLMSARSP